jgi:hypothetical protein
MKVDSFYAQCYSSAYRVVPRLDREIQKALDRPVKPDDGKVLVIYDAVYNSMQRPGDGPFPADGKKADIDGCSTSS